MSSKFSVQKITVAKNCADRTHACSGIAKFILDLNSVVGLVSSGSMVVVGGGGGGRGA